MTGWFGVIWIDSKRRSTNSVRRLSNAISTQPQSWTPPQIILCALFCIDSICLHNDLVSEMNNGAAYSKTDRIKPLKIFQSSEVDILFLRILQKYKRWDAHFNTFLKCSLKSSPLSKVTPRILTVATALIENISLGRKYKILLLFWFIAFYCF